MMKHLRLTSIHGVEVVFYGPILVEKHAGKESPYEPPSIVVRWEGTITSFPVNDVNRTGFVNAFGYW